MTTSGSAADADESCRKSGDAHEDIKKLVGISGPVPRWIPITLLAFSSVAIIAPVILFRRYKPSLGHSHVDAQHLHASPVTPNAPPRRGRLRAYGDSDNSKESLPSSTTQSPSLRPRGKLRSSPTHMAHSTPVEPSSTASGASTSEEDHFNAPLYTLKAFSIATTIVISGAAATVASVMSYLDVRDTTEFGERMRTWVSKTMPVLSTQIYRQPTPRDSLPGVAPSPATSESEGSLGSATFDHDASQQRLSDAFDNGGFDAWAQAAEREMEAETEMERSRKKQEFRKAS